jgi:hypothetical protein
MVTSCGESAAKCSYVPTADNLTGTLIEHRGNHAEFVIESILPSSSRPPIGAPALAVGEHVKVHYDGSTAQFLQVGSRYVIGLWADQRRSPGVGV